MASTAKQFQVSGQRPRVVVVGRASGAYVSRTDSVKCRWTSRGSTANHHTFQPLMYQVALAVLSPGDIAQPIRTILRNNRSTEVWMDDVVGIDEVRRVHTKCGAEILYDFDKGEMAMIGRKAAVARIVWPFHAHWSGFMAWLTWLVVHIFFLIGFRNRLSVFRNWAWTYLRLEDGVHLIDGSQDLPGWAKLAVTPAPDTSGSLSPSAGVVAPAPVFAVSG